MVNTKVKYLGLELDNPLIVGSCGITEKIQGVEELAKYNPGAIVLKSLFEEEIIREIQESVQKMYQTQSVYPEIFDFFDTIQDEDSVSKYLFLIEEAKKKVKTPIIASINCVSASDEWVSFTERIQDAGADAIELNAFILPTNLSNSGKENEQIYFDIANKVKKISKIPVAMKVSFYFSNLALFLSQLSKTGIDGLVLFNRFFSQDIDLDRMILTPASLYSHQDDLYKSLNWVAIMANRVSCDLAASTGVHTPEDFIKQLLAGANAVQVVSALYKNGMDHIETILKGLEEWMNHNEYETIDEFRGKLSQAQSLNPAAYERVQFMKHFSGKS